jgi:hypothetical protein
MGRIQVVLDDAREQKLKEVIFKTKGMKKGNISEAVEEAIDLWIERQMKKEVREK